jgi:hypothetical protein
MVGDGDADDPLQWRLVPCEADRATSTLRRIALSPCGGNKLEPDLPLVRTRPVIEQVQPNAPYPATTALLKCSLWPETVLLPHLSRSPQDLIDDDPW